MDLFIEPPEVEAVIAKLKSPQFSKKDTDLTYRAINHYQKVGIIPEARMDSRSWRKFSGYEFIWLDVVTQLRNFGVRLESLSALRIKLFEEGSLGYIDKASFITRSFFKEVAFSIHLKYKLFLIVFSDFSYTFHDSKSLKQWLEKAYKEESHISVPLTTPINTVWASLSK